MQRQHDLALSGRALPRARAQGAARIRVAGRAGAVIAALVGLNLLVSLGANASPGVRSTALTTFAVLHQPAPGYTPDQLRTAYTIDPLLAQGVDGSGQAVALIELDRFAPSDIQQFDAANQLPTPKITQYYAGGKPFTLPQQGETTMDIEWAHALAPGAAIQIYYLKGNQVSASSWKAMAGTVNTAVANGANTISVSLGTCGPTRGYGVARQAFAAALGRGVSIFVSSGDSGPYRGSPRDCGRSFGLAYPAADPSVVSVGGTSLLLNPDNTVADEVAWHLSGGGNGKPLPRPTWQLASRLGPGRYRYGPDVSFLANPATGAAVFYRGSWQPAGGTSLGAPAWAAIWLLVREDAAQVGVTVGAASSLLYRIGNSSAYSQAFNDVTSGTNGRYSAGPGWDPVTGWGTPNAAGLAAAAISSPSAR